VLFIRRAKDPAAGKLGLPGGFVDFGETAEEALRREAREEVGLDLASLRYLTSVPNRYDYAGVTYHTLDLYFVALAGHNAEPRPLDAVESVCWLDPESVTDEQVAFESLRRALAMLRAQG
jgi:ADP-ribose pyrophosphatase YjhB (NUDIX family)